jgi:hypothetical protein
VGKRAQLQDPASSGLNMEAADAEQDRQLALEPAFGRAALRGSLVGFSVATAAFTLLGLALHVEFGGALGLGVFVGIWGGFGWGGMIGATVCFMRAEGRQVVHAVPPADESTFDRPAGRAALPVFPHRAAHDH